MPKSCRLLLLSVACAAALQAQAQGANAPAGPIDLPAGELSAALDTLARRSGTQLVYRSDQVQGVRTGGVRGAPSADAALQKLLGGSDFVSRHDPSTGAVLIVRRDMPKRAPAPFAQADEPAGGAPAAPAPPPQELEAVQITGSRIPRTQIEGPAPVTVISERDIKAGGFVSVPDVLRAITQNSGET
ncbi:MAG: hypothetical protein KAX84_14355, partial [Burkholderiales bacterium]|nr:hypothetical protein [Burkholderiales bacterium]